ncbi:MAG: phosphoenolpyruvate--protein phosphotransferase [Acidobacteriota bacterium]
MDFSNESSPIKKPTQRDVRMQGLAASSGIAVGRALRLDEKGRQQIFYVVVSSNQVRSEVRRLRDAITEARAQLEEIRSKLVRELGIEHSYILDSHLMMLEDERFQAELKQEIRARKINAEWAVRAVTDRIVSAYKQVQDSYLRERSTDLEDVAARLINILSGHTKFNPEELNEKVVLVAEDILPSTVAELNFNNVLGFATNSGGLTSHSAIIARALNIPAVVGLHDITLKIKTGDAMVIDGTAGEVILRPTKPLIRDYLEKSEHEAKRPTNSATRVAEPTMTIDGVRIKLRANLELPNEIVSLPLFGAEGIGLYRSEFMFLNRLPNLPDEEEQCLLYSWLAESAGDAGASIRIFDLGGDKLSLQGFEGEANPALGMRAIRLSLRVQEIFKTQLRAIFRANMQGNLRVILPLVTTINELREAKKIIEEVKRDLKNERVKYNPNTKLGVMIEVPAAAMMADLFAHESDYLCVGTNDLIQYILAVDRANESVAHLYQPFHPAVLRTLAHLVRVAEAENKPLEVCGEMASDPVQAIALVGLGVRTLSMVPTSIPLIKNALATIDCSSVRELMTKALKLASADEVQELLSKELPNQAPRLVAALASQS